MGWPAGHPEKGDYGPVGEVAAVLVAFADWLDTTSDTVAAACRMVAGSWEGEAAEAFLEVGHRIAKISAANSEEARQAATALRLVCSIMDDDVFSTARGVQAEKHDAEDELARAEQRLAEDAAVNPLSLFAIAEAQRVRHYRGEITACIHRLKRIGAERDTEAATAARKITRIEFQPIKFASGRDTGGTAILTSGSFGQGPSPELVTTPLWWIITDLSDQSPTTIRSHWDQLSDAQRHALITSNPMLYGNLDGIPLGWRANANEINIRNEIAQLKAEQDKLKETQDGGPLETFMSGLTGGNSVIQNMKQIEKIQEKIDYYEVMLGTAPRLEPGQDNAEKTWRTSYYDENGKLVPVDDPRRANWPKGSLILAFDPAQQAIATYHGIFTEQGDIPAGYDNVGMYVPGTGTKIDGWLEGADLRGAQLHHGSNTSGLGSQAMIVYSGGPQPQNVPNAVVADFAQDMGPKLALFANTYVPPELPFTVMGHSYGATIVAQAEALGLQADRVLYVAPAGYGEAPESFLRDERYYPPSLFGGGGSMVPQTRYLGLDDFPATGDKPHYVMISRGDTVVGLIQNDPFNLHGDSPTHDPRVTRLETGFADTEHTEYGYVDEAPKFENHSSPFFYGTTAYDNMVQVLMGGTAEGWGGPEIHKEPENGAHPEDPGAGADYKNKEDWPDVDIE